MSVMTMGKGTSAVYSRPDITPMGEKDQATKNAVAKAEREMPEAHLGLVSSRRGIGLCLAVLCVIALLAAIAWWRWSRSGTTEFPNQKEEIHAQPDAEPTNLMDRIIIPDNDSLNPPQVTVTAWIKTKDDDGFYNRIVDKDFRKGYSLDLGGDFNGKALRGKPGFEIKDMFPFADERIGDDRWHHLAGTYAGFVARLYVDGMKVKQSKSRRPGPIPRNHWDVCVGNSVVEIRCG